VQETTRKQLQARTSGCPVRPDANQPEQQYNYRKNNKMLNRLLGLSRSDVYSRVSASQRGRSDGHHHHRSSSNQELPVAPLGIVHVCVRVYSKVLNSRL
jgi:type II secretory pathway component PulJ